MCLSRVALLDSLTRKHFYIDMITIGPKHCQKTQKVNDFCQEWTNSKFTIGKTSTEKVYRIKVCIPSFSSMLDWDVHFAKKNFF